LANTRLTPGVTGVDRMTAPPTMPRSYATLGRAQGV
jgi:hypothetical protein